MDPNSILNLVLVVCAIVLVIALIYRTVRGEPAREETGEDARQPYVPTEAIQERLPLAPVRVPVEEGRFGPLFASISTENPDEVRKSAGRMLDYAILRGGAAHVRPEILEKIALQFGLLEVVLREASRGDARTGGISDEEMSQILRESFRRAASQARD